MARLLAGFLVGHCVEKFRTYPAAWGRPCGGTAGLAKQPRRRSPWTSRKRLHFLNSLQGPGCLAKSGLVWLASGCQKKRFGWLLAGFWLLLAGFLVASPCLEKSRTYLAETGWTSPLPGGGLVEALPLPQTKQSRWRNSTHGLKQPRRRWLRFLNSLQGPGCLAKSGLSCLVWLASGYQKKRFGWLLAGFWLASGWLLAGFLVWKNLVLTWLKLAGPPRCLGAALWRHCPSHKRSKVDGTIPRVGLRSNRLGRPEKGCTSLTPCKAQAALPNQPSLAWFGWLLAIKKKVWLASGFWLAFWLDIPLPGKQSYLPG